MSGTVTYGGKPIEGTIVFTPSGNSTERLATEAPIRGGRYEMPTVSAGTKSVDVYMTEAASDPTKIKEKSAIPSPTLLVPEPRTVEVQPGSQTMDFSLTR